MNVASRGRIKHLRDRWSDTYFWSPSRMSGPFLIYHEIERCEPGSQQDADQPDLDIRTPPNYRLKREGLIKKTISIHMPETFEKFHLVSYYTLEDLAKKSLEQPCRDPNINLIPLPKSLFAALPYIPTGLRKRPVKKQRIASPLDPSIQQVYALPSLVQFSTLDLGPLDSFYEQNPRLEDEKTRLKQSPSFTIDFPKLSREERSSIQIIQSSQQDTVPLLKRNLSGSSIPDLTRCSSFS